MRHADQENGARPVSDRQEIDRPSLARRADRLEAGETGVVADERARARPQLLEREEFPVLRNTGEQRGQIGQDSSFDE
jgi:hypothetical protein